MSYLDRIKTCNNWNSTHYLPWVINNKTYGWIRPAFAEHLKQWPDVFLIDDQQIILNPELTDYDTRTKTLTPIIQSLHTQGIIDTWVNENYPVNHQFGEKGELEFERAATLYFGTLSYGVHMNGLVQKSDGVYVWTGIRAKDKAFFPGMLDQLVAGGQPVGISLHDNLIKEAAEEANIPATITNNATIVSQVTYQQEGDRGLDQSTIYNFDLWLPEDFVPENTDGEVEAFRLLPIEEILELTEHTTEFKDNCNLTNIDLLIRQGLLTEKHPDYTQIHQQLYRSHQ
jgi:8-oxo-dGTP pyrophosphatase MutT (NUDIX family)